MPRSELAGLDNPAMAGLLASIVGPWGATLINIGVIISIAGAMFSYTIVCADSAYAPALAGCFPRFLRWENRAGAPAGALVLTALVIQGFLIMVYFQESSYQAMYTLATSAIMIPFVLSALYCLKTTLDDHRLGTNRVTASVWIISLLGTIYGFYMLLATGLSNVIISAFCFAPGFFVYAWSRKQSGAPVFASKADVGAFAVIVAFLGVALIL
jgi:arginine:ornithine antiporter/lysine permease